MPKPIELRSDTFTQPTDAMRQAIAHAIVGDDMVGEDPTVNELERRMCDTLGLPAAVYMCSGTQSNQAAIWSHTRPGDELLIESTGHIANWEAGGPAVCSGVSVRLVAGAAGMLTPEDLDPVLRSPDQHCPRQTLLCLENTTNLGGGRVWPFEQFQDVCAWARANGLKIHLDGARLFNAVIASGVPASEWAAEVDSVSICFSKGLGCPMGSALVSSEAVIHDARRARKIFGGALRQAGMMAAAALHSINHHVDRLADDHANARRFAEGLASVSHVSVSVKEVETNMVFITVDDDWGTAEEFSKRLTAAGVNQYDVGPQTIRTVFHLDVTADHVDQAVAAVAEIAANPTH